MWSGILLGVLTFVGLFLVWRKAPRWTKNIILKVAFLADIAVTVGAYIALSSITSSLAGAVGCAIVGICVSAGLGMEQSRKKKRTNDRQSADRN